MNEAIQKEKKYFTSPLGEVNHCNNCKEPILEKKGRYHVGVDYDFYSRLTGHRFCNLYGYKTFCTKCFDKLFGPFEFKNAESIYKKE